MTAVRPGDGKDMESSGRIRSDIQSSDVILCPTRLTLLVDLDVLKSRSRRSDNGIEPLNHDQTRFSLLRWRGGHVPKQFSHLFQEMEMQMEIIEFDMEKKLNASCAHGTWNKAYRVQGKE